MGVAAHRDHEQEVDLVIGEAHASEAGKDPHQVFADILARCVQDVDEALLGPRRMDEAAVEVSETRFYNGDLFSNSQYSTEFTVYLNLDDGEWKIVDSELFFASCWATERACSDFDIYR